MAFLCFLLIRRKELLSELTKRSWKGPNDPSCWPTLGPYRYLRGAPKGPFGLKQALTGIKALGARLGARFGPNRCRLVQLGWSHGYHTLWPVGTKSGSRGPSESLQDSQKGHFGPKRALLGALGAKKRSQVCGIQSRQTNQRRLGPNLAPESIQDPQKRHLGPKQAL